MNESANDVVNNAVQTNDLYQQHKQEILEILSSIHKNDLMKQAIVQPGEVNKGLLSRMFNDLATSNSKIPSALLYFQQREKNMGPEEIMKDYSAILIKEGYRILFDSQGNFNPKISQALDTEANKRFIEEMGGVESDLMKNTVMAAYLIVLGHHAGRQLSPLLGGDSPSEERLLLGQTLMGALQANLTDNKKAIPAKIIQQRLATEQKTNLEILEKNLDKLGMSKEYAKWKADFDRAEKNNDPQAIAEVSQQTEKLLKQLENKFDITIKQHTGSPKGFMSNTIKEPIHATVIAMTALSQLTETITPASQTITSETFNKITNYMAFHSLPNDTKKIINNYLADFQNLPNPAEKRATSENPKNEAKNAPSVDSKQTAQQIKRCREELEGIQSELWPARSFAHINNGKDWRDTHKQLQNLKQCYNQLDKLTSKIPAQDNSTESTKLKKDINCIKHEISEYLKNNALPPHKRIAVGLTEAVTTLTETVKNNKKIVGNEILEKLDKAKIEIDTVKDMVSDDKPGIKEALMTAAKNMDTATEKLLEQADERSLSILTKTPFYSPVRKFFEFVEDKKDATAIENLVQKALNTIQSVVKILQGNFTAIQAIGVTKGMSPNNPAPENSTAEKSSLVKT